MSEMTDALYNIANKLRVLEKHLSELYKLAGGIEGDDISDYHRYETIRKALEKSKTE